MTDAVEIESLQLRRMDDVAYGDLSWRSRQDITSARATSAGNHTGTPQPQQNLLDIICGKAFLPRDFTPVDGPQIGALRKVEGADHAVLGPGCYPHILTIGRAGALDKGIALGWAWYEAMATSTSNAFLFDASRTALTLSRSTQPRFPRASPRAPRSPSFS